MSTEIELPDGTRATVDRGRWQCSDPKAIPVLDYFTEKAFKKMQYERHIDAYIAREVVAVIVGSRVVHIDPIDYNILKGARY